MECIRVHTHTQASRGRTIQDTDIAKKMGIAYPEEVPRLSEDIIELIEKYNVSAACFLPPPRSIDLILQLSWLDIGVFAALTALTALSLIIYLENTHYLLKKVSCLIKVKTLVWISAAPT
ncbi:hypothetical protein chiPu_0011929, partial [Chiloscyllium punctatum]|nr:hypothetical protein [Chiloscyllium punctatum]